MPDATVWISISMCQYLFPRTVVTVRGGQGGAVVTHLPPTHL